MSGRCIACNKTLSEGELVSKFKRSDGEVEFRDSCSTCFSVSMKAAHGADYVEDDEALIREIVDGRDSENGTLPDLSE